VKAVRFDEYGDVDVLKVVDVPTPAPGPGQVLVQVKAAGINPGEAKIREGLLHSRWEDRPHVLNAACSERGGSSSSIVLWV